MQIGLSLGISARMRSGVSETSLATLHASDWTTANTLQLDGAYWLRPYDLEAMGAEGAAIAATNGRYAWLVSSDHHAGFSGYAGGAGIWLGYSSDPGILPENFRMIIPYTVTVGAPVTGAHVQMETPWLVYNPDDATYPFYLYGHGDTASDGGRGQETLLFKSADLSTFTTPVVTHNTTNNAGHTGYQPVFREGVNDWISLGLGGITSNPGIQALWTSTDGATFTKSRDLTRASSTSRVFDIENVITYNGVTYTVGHEDDRTSGGKMSGSMLPAEADWDIEASANDDAIVLTRQFAGVFPTANYVKSMMSYTEDGVLHMWLRRGSFSEQSVPKNDWTDYYSFVIDATTAANAEPVGVRASCASSAVSVQWYDALPHQNYRVARSSSASGPWTDLSDVTGLSYTDSSPTADAVNYYRVTTLNSGEQGSRIVSTYASSASAIVNKHYTRVLKAGGTGSTIDATWLQTVYDWLQSQGLTNSLVCWTSPGFGVKYSSAPTVDIVFDLAATITPQKRRDAKVRAASYEYETTSLGVAAINPTTTTAWLALHDGLFNPIRQRSGVTVAAAYLPESTTNQSRLVSLWNFQGIEMQHAPASDRIEVRAQINGGSTFTATATASDTAKSVAIGTWTSDGTLTAYCNGTAGTPLAAGTPSSARPIAGAGLGQDGAGGNQIAHTGVGLGQLTAVPNTGVYTASSIASRSVLSDMIVFDVGLSASQAASLNTLLTDRIT